jgi:hypothetical protein
VGWGRPGWGPGRSSGSAKKLKHKQIATKKKVAFEKIAVKIGVGRPAPRPAPGVCACSVVACVAGPGWVVLQVAFGWLAGGVGEALENARHPAGVPGSPKK